ncbi:MULTISPECIES: transcriptional regulator FilR1 domain-containing protein [unclassified Archaeoglobus]|jgi:predicted transcriptional regulator|uniref:transcriptional regulator FilR1 domain-containing protein n=1 Tax=unclassified Archaeoglobus TaxID=2643606 RepID=UPI0025BF7FA2|nr:MULTISPECIES: transcriptional regulator FilR1 domain-containing protein [unclassified Archaeoglobus]
MRRLEKENVSFYVSERDFRFPSIVADEFFSTSFYFANGAFDYKRDFTCRSEDARRWGLTFLTT